MGERTKRGDSKIATGEGQEREGVWGDAAVPRPGVHSRSRENRSAHEKRRWR